MPVLPDWAIEPYIKISKDVSNSEAIQKILESVKSWLSKKKCYGQHPLAPKNVINCGSNGMLFSQFLDLCCQAYNINPLWILASIQREQSGIFSTRELPMYVQEKILGYGVTEEGTLTQYLGFENQIKFATRSFRTYDTRVSNWQKLKIKLYDSVKDREWLVNNKITVVDPYTPESKTDAKALIYTPRLRALYLSLSCLKRIYDITAKIFPELTNIIKT